MTSISCCPVLLAASLTTMLRSGSVLVNKVSFILELYPRTKEIYVITVLTQDREAINKKRNTVVIKILPAVEREDVVESKVVYYDYDLRIRAFKKLYEQVMDASCLPCED